MQIGIVSFSGREYGNCNKILEYIKKKVIHDNEKIDALAFKFSDFIVHRCNDCNYECFGGKCVFKNDDIYNAYGMLSKCKVIIYIIPVFAGNPCSNFFIFNEREQGAFTLDEDYNRFDGVKKKFIIIGNTGFHNVKQIIMNNDIEKYNHRDFLNIRSQDVGEKSIIGNLIEYEVFKRCISDFIEGIYAKM